MVLEPQKVAKKSPDILEEKLAELRKIIPEVFEENRIDWVKLKMTLGDTVQVGPEKYGLNWAGRSEAYKAAQIPATGALVPQEKESKNWDSTENIFIEGDNLEVLKLLQAHYRGKIKMIYIDPPYNTGKDFIYKDNFTENRSDYYERTGQSRDGIKLTSNLESNGRYHSDWLTMMYPRLFLAKNLLRDDGVIFVSIDDNEVANLRLLMNEIFGEENFIAQIVWEKSYAPVNLKKTFSENHEFIIVYSKNFDLVRIRPLERSEEQNQRYDNPDNDPRGVWKSSDLSVGPRIDSKVFEITTPTGRKILPPAGRCWVFSKERYEEMLADNRIWFGKNNDAVPSYKRFLAEVKQGVTPLTIWKYSDVGHTQQSRKELIKLFNEVDCFETPKPVELVKRMLKLSSDPTDLIFDFFAGSGTTAHAVMDLNAEDGGNRKYILVQIPEGVEEGSEAAKAGFKTIADISRERIRKAGERVSKGDIGFKAFSLSKSNYRQWNVLTDENNEEDLKKQMQLFAEKPLVDSWDEKAVVYEVLEKEGFSLNSKVEKIEQAGNEFWSVKDGDRKMIISFAEKITQEQVVSLKLSEETLFVCFDSALDDSEKVNLMRNCNLKVV